MPTPVKFVAYFVILIVMAFISNSLPKSTEPLKMLFAVAAFAWIIGGCFIVLRAGFRFITR